MVWTVFLNLTFLILEKTERHTPPEVKRTRGKWLRLLTGDQLQMQTMIWPGLILCFIFCY